MKDFIIDYIPKKSININNIDQLNKTIKKQKKEYNIIKLDNTNNVVVDTIQNKLIESDKSNNQIILFNKDDILSTTLTKSELYKKMF
jgi:hypothetical protein